MHLTPLDLAKRYLIDDVPSATMIASRLYNLLEAHGRGQPLTRLGRDFLVTRGLQRLASLLAGELSEDEYLAGSAQDREERLVLAKQRARAAEEQKRIARQRLNERVTAYWAEYEAERIRRENAPQYIAKKNSQALRHKYGLYEYIEPTHFKRLMSILHRFESRTRLIETDVLWLQSKGRDYRTEEVLTAYHSLEADFYMAEYKRTNDPWHAVNASSHLRKCANAQQAVELLSTIRPLKPHQLKLQAAIHTTHGGALRDQKQFAEAQQLGKKAHELQPNDYRPCTLLGAINVEQGHYDIGHKWYLMAEERGMSKDGLEHELRALLTRMPTEKRESAIRELVRIDPYQYRWLKKLSLAKGKGRKAHRG